MTALYEPHIIEVGILKPEEVVAITMPRSVFLDTVRDTIGELPDHARESLSEKLLPVASTMERFPLGTWIDSTRGCGCVVGEYLVAADIIERQNADYYANPARVEALLAIQPDGGMLWQFGSRIDAAVQRLLCDEIGEPDDVDEVEGIAEVHHLCWTGRMDTDADPRDVVVVFEEDTA